MILVVLLTGIAKSLIYQYVQQLGFFTLFQADLILYVKNLLCLLCFL